MGKSTREKESKSIECYCILKVSKYGRICNLSNFVLKIIDQRCHKLSTTVDCLEYLVLIVQNWERMNKYLDLCQFQTFIKILIDLLYTFINTLIYLQQLFCRRRKGNLQQIYEY